MENGFDPCVEVPDAAFIDACRRMAGEALEAEQTYVRERLELYDKRSRTVLARSIVTAWCGWGRCGKDEAGLWLGTNSTLVYPTGGTSKVANPLVARALNLSHEESFNYRHSCRQFWFHFCNALRDLHSQTLLVKMVLAEGEMVTGIRSKKELQAAQREQLIDESIWIHRVGTPRDFTVEYDEFECKHVIINDGDLAAYHAKLARMCSDRFDITLK